MASQALLPISVQTVLEMAVLRYRSWFININENCIYIEGFVETDKDTLKRVESGKICKRISSTALLDAQGTFVELCGSLDQTFQAKNEIPHEVSQKFIHGFPEDWEMLIKVNRYIKSKQRSMGMREGLSIEAPKQNIRLTVSDSDPNQPQPIVTFYDTDTDAESREKTSRSTKKKKKTSFEERKEKNKDSKTTSLNPARMEENKRDPREEIFDDPSEVSVYQRSAFMGVAITPIRCKKIATKPNTNVFDEDDTVSSGDKSDWTKGEKSSKSHEEKSKPSRESSVSPVREKEGPEKVSAPFAVPKLPQRFLPKNGPPGDVEVPQYRHSESQNEPKSRLPVMKKKNAKELDELEEMLSSLSDRVRPVTMQSDGDNRHRPNERRDYQRSSSHSLSRRSESRSPPVERLKAQNRPRLDIGYQDRKREEQRNKSTHPIEVQKDRKRPITCSSDRSAGDSDPERFRQSSMKKKYSYEKAPSRKYTKHESSDDEIDYKYHSKSKKAIGDQREMTRIRDAVPSRKNTGTDYDAPQGSRMVSDERRFKDRPLVNRDRTRTSEIIVDEIVQLERDIERICEKRQQLDDTRRQAVYDSDVKENEIRRKQRELEQRMREIEEREQAVREAERRTMMVAKLKSNALSWEEKWLNSNEDALIDDGDANTPMINRKRGPKISRQPRNVPLKGMTIVRQSPRLVARAKTSVMSNYKAPKATKRSLSTTKRETTRVRSPSPPPPPKRVVWTKKDTEKLKRIIASKKPTGDPADWAEIVRLLAKPNVTADECKKVAIAKLKWKEPVVVAVKSPEFETEENTKKTRSRFQKTEAELRRQMVASNTDKFRDVVNGLRRNEEPQSDIDPSDVSADESLLGGIENMTENREQFRNKGGKRRTFIPVPVSETPSQSKENNEDDDSLRHSDDDDEKEHEKTARYVHQLLTKPHVAKKSRATTTLVRNNANISTMSVEEANRTALRMIKKRKTDVADDPLEEESEFTDDSILSMS